MTSIFLLTQDKVQMVCFLQFSHQDQKALQMTYNLKRAQNHVWQHFVRFSSFLVNENSVYLSTSLDFDDLFKNWEQKKSRLFFCDFLERFVFFTFFMDFVHISQTRWILSIEYKSFSREQLLSQSFCQLFHFDSCGPRIPDLIQLMGFFYILGRPLRAYICKGYSTSLQHRNI